MAGRVRVFVAASIDGFIAGQDHDLSWLPSPTAESGEDYGWGAFIADIGCLLMGRGTYDAVDAMDVDWPHTERDTVVATNRPLVDPPARVFADSGTIEELIERAKQRAAGKDVYIDGGNLIRQALDAGLVHEAIITQCPTVLGAGHPLFAGTKHRHAMKLVDVRRLDGDVVQMTYVPAK